MGAVGKFTFRDRLDIAACILQVADPSSRKTRIIYRCNMSLVQAERYVGLLVDGGLLENQTIRGKTVYRTTDDGRSLLEDYQRIKSILDQMR